LKKTSDLIGKISIESKIESVNEDAQRKAIKRMESSNCGIEEEKWNGPTLKKTKESTRVNY